MLPGPYLPCIAVVYFWFVPKVPWSHCALNPVHTLLGTLFLAHHLTDDGRTHDSVLHTPLNDEIPLQNPPTGSWGVRTRLKSIRTST